MKLSVSSKRTFALCLTMSILFIILLVYGIFATSGLSDTDFSSENAKDCKNSHLKQVHVFFRHGQRTPADTYPNDKYINETFSPFGWGQLTNVGRRMQYDTGSWIRLRYGKFLGSSYSTDIVYAQSTEVSRAQMSLQLVLAGLFPPKDTSLDWNYKLNWQPIPYTVQPLVQDDFLLVRIPCPRYYEELKRVEKETHYADIISENSELFKNLSKITGSKIATLDDVQSLYSTLKAEQDLGLKLPEWTTDLMPQLLNLTIQSYIYNVYTPELRKLKGGNFLKRTFSDWNKAANNQKTPKIFVYSGHDSTVTNILSTFNVWEPQFPAYGIMGILELHADPQISGSHNVKIFLKKTENRDAQQLAIPGCKKSCSLEQMELIYEKLIPANLIDECKANDGSVTAPPPPAP